MVDNLGQLVEGVTTPKKILRRVLRPKNKQNWLQIVIPIETICSQAFSARGTPRNARATTKNGEERLKKTLAIRSDPAGWGIIAWWPWCGLERAEVPTIRAFRGGKNSKFHIVRSGNRTPPCSSTLTEHHTKKYFHTGIGCKRERRD